MPVLNLKQTNFLKPLKALEILGIKYEKLILLLYNLVLIIYKPLLKLFRIIHFFNVSTVPCKVRNLVKQIRCHFFWTAKIKFCEFLGFGQIACRIGQLFRFRMYTCRDLS